MKLFILLTLIFSSLAQATDITLETHNYVLRDILRQGYNKEALFSRMDRSFIKLGGSICANRAHMWSYDFDRYFDVDTAKLFLFYTKKTGEGTTKTWWYHVAPVINEGGVLWMMDAGFPRGIRGPVQINPWLKYFTGSTNCRAIQDTDTELIEMMFKGRTFPETTRYGTYDCYYRIVPEGFWFPSTVATNLLGRDSSGRPARVDRNDFVRGEVFQACVEAVTGSVSRWLGGGKKECEEWMSRR
ncbi:MAG: protein-glutamine glutaminase family protein [Bacteriovoracia bacterium]